MKQTTDAMPRIGKYHLLRELGQGGMGRVWLAHDPLLDRHVAIKTLNRSGWNHDQDARFLREAQMAARLNHPHVVTVYDFGHTPEGTPFLVMEYLEGHDLLDEMESSTPLPRILTLMRQAADGLANAHDAGIVHRDIKPSNIMVLQRDVVKILDFGLSSLGTSSLTQSQMLMGTPQYIAPERIQGHRADPRSDQFSLGLVLYEWLTRQNPFQADNIPGILHRIVTISPPALSPEGNPLSEQINTILAHLLARQPEHRLPNLHALSEMLGALEPEACQVLV